MRACAGSNAYGDDDTAHDASVESTQARAGVVAISGRRGCRLLVCPCHLSTTCRAYVVVAQGGCTAAAEEERGVAKEEEAKVEEVKVVVVVEEEVDVLVWIGARQRGRSSTLQDARPAPTSARAVQGKRQREREQGDKKHIHQHR